jgi:hypothetical protein
MKTATRPSRSLKSQVLNLVEQMPDDCTVDDIHYQLYVIDKINRGEDALRRRGGIPHAQVRKAFARWLTK